MYKYKWVCCDMFFQGWGPGGPQCHVIFTCAVTCSESLPSCLHFRGNCLYQVHVKEVLLLLFVWLPGRPSPDVGPGL